MDITWGYNAGLLFANYDKLIKLDCDIYISPDFIKQNKFFEDQTSNVFYTGNWETLSSTILKWTNDC